MNGLNSAITVPAEDLSSQPGTHADQLGRPQNYNQWARKLNTPCGWRPPGAQKLWASPPPRPGPLPRSPQPCHYK